MLSKPAKTPKKLVNRLIFTNLEGALIDGDRNDWKQARSALSLAREKRIPVISVSNQTFEESIELQKEMSLNYPFIFEGGAGIAFPKKNFNKPAKYYSDEQSGYWICALSTSYANIRLELLNLRRNEKYQFLGFGDMKVEKIANLEGCSLAMAEMAKNRRHSEPIIWKDGAKEFDKFIEATTKLNLTVTRAKNLLHVSGPGDKSTSMLWLTKIYASSYGHIPHIIAIGGLKNDVPMLNAANTAVVIRQKESFPLQIKAKPPSRQLLQPVEYGARGWNQAITTLITDAVKESA